MHIASPSVEVDDEVAQEGQVAVEKEKENIDRQSWTLPSHWIKVALETWS